MLYYFYITELSGTHPGSLLIPFLSEINPHCLSAVGSGEKPAPKKDGITTCLPVDVRPFRVS